MFDFSDTFSDQAQEPSGGKWVRYESTELECYFEPAGNRRWAAVIACLPDEAQRDFAEIAELRRQVQESYDDEKINRMVELEERNRDWNIEILAKAGWTAWRLRSSNGSGKPSASDVQVTDGGEVMEPGWESRKKLLARHPQLWSWALAQCGLRATERAEEAAASGKGSPRPAASTSDTSRVVRRSASKSNGSKGSRAKRASKPRRRPSATSSESSSAEKNANDPS